MRIGSFIVVLAAAAALSFAACTRRQELSGGLSAHPEQPADLRALDAGQADPERGEAIAVGAYGGGPEGACFRCHGLHGEGDAGSASPRLHDQVYKYLYDSLKDYASGIRRNEIMSPIATALNDDEMRDVAAYYSTRPGSHYGPAPVIDPQLLQLGGALAAVGSAERGIQGCVNCHGPEGIGLPPTYPYLAAQHARYMEIQLLAWKSGARRGDGLQIMENIAERLTNEEIRAVSLYYSAMRPSRLTPEWDEMPGPQLCETHRNTEAHAHCMAKVLRPEAREQNDAGRRPSERAAENRSRQNAPRSRP